MPACNERFGATAAGSADLNGSAEIPPLPQAVQSLLRNNTTADSSPYPPKTVSAAST
jgi:hypothetical protein